MFIMIIICLSTDNQQPIATERLPQETKKPMGQSQAMQTKCEGYIGKLGALKKFIRRREIRVEITIS